MSKIKSRDENLVVQEFENETIVYDLLTSRAYLLNETAAFVWRSLDGKNEVRAVAVNLAQKNKGAVNEDLVWLAIEELKKQNLIADADKVPTHFAGMNRREVVKKVGLATMIALPLVSSLIAPSAAMAQSVNCSATPKPNGCPVGVRLTRTNANPLAPLPTCADITQNNSICDLFYGTQCQSTNAVATNCTQNSPIQVGFDCVCAA